MECPCGGIISTTNEMLSSTEALLRFPNQKTLIPDGYDVLSVRYGVCPCDGRFGLHVTKVKASGTQTKNKSVFRFFKN